MRLSSVTLCSPCKCISSKRCAESRHISNKRCTESHHISSKRCAESHHISNKRCTESHHISNKRCTESHHISNTRCAESHHRGLCRTPVWLDDLTWTTRRARMHVHSHACKHVHLAGEGFDAGHCNSHRHGSKFAGVKARPGACQSRHVYTSNVAVLAIPACMLVSASAPLVVRCSRCTCSACLHHPAVCASASAWPWPALSA